MGLNINSYPVFEKLFGEKPTEAGKALKDSFEDKDKQLILLYFKWLTKKNAKNVGINQLAITGTMSAAVKAFLTREGLLDVKDWEFTGMVDYGVKGAVKCSHGQHQLRYAYFAYSPSTNRELIFGQNCASDFFDVDTATLGSFVKIIDKASRELCAILNKGRYSREFTYTDNAVNCFKMLNHSSSMMSNNPELAELYDSIAMRCYSYIGRTAMELWANFISRGLLLPATLREIVISGYQQAAIDVFKSKAEYTTYLGYYLKVRDTESTYLDKKSIPGEFIPPISNLSLTDALRVCIIEEIISPTSIANRFDLLGLYKNLSAIEKLTSGYKKRYSRAEIFARQMIRAGKKDIGDPLTCMLVGLIRNDLRIVTFLMGLTQGSLKQADIVSYAKWYYSRYKIGDINLFEMCWCDDNWYANLKHYIDARHPKRSLLVFLYGVLYPDIANAIVKSKPQFHCCYLDDDYPEYPDDLGLLSVDDLNNTAYDANYKKRHILKPYGTSKGLAESDFPDSGTIPEDADFFATQEDLKIAEIVQDLNINSQTPAVIDYKRTKGSSRGKIMDTTERRDYFGSDDEEELYSEGDFDEEGTFEETDIEDIEPEVEDDEPEIEDIEPEIEDDEPEIEDDEPEIEEEALDEDTPEGTFDDDEPDEDIPEGTFDDDEPYDDFDDIQDDEEDLYGEDTGDTEGVTLDANTDLQSLLFGGDKNA